jgi:hypothetical protein
MLLEVNALTNLIVDGPREADIDLWAAISALTPTIFVVDTGHDIDDWRERLPDAAHFLYRANQFVNNTEADIKHALDHFGADPHETAFVTNDSSRIGEATQTRVGTILMADGVGEDTIPDVIIFSGDDAKQTFEDLIGGKRYGFVNEMYATRFGDTTGAGGTSFLFTQTILKNRTELPRNLRRKLEVVVGGRYFPRADARHDKHQLSMRMAHFKTGDRRGAPIVRGLATVLKLVFQQQVCDVITRVPPKPSKATDHLGDALTQAARLIRGSDPRPLARIELDAITCIADYPQQKDAGGWASRVNNVSDVFDANAEIVAGKSVLLVDDVLTSGATLVEAARTLLEAGATEVLLCPIAIDQHIINYDFSDVVPCPSDNCTGHMQIRFKRTGDAAFWGCSTYFDTNCNGRMDFKPGWQASNEQNTRDGIWLITSANF